VTVSFQIPRSQLDLATQIVGELGATLQAASDQAAGGGVPGGDGMPPDNSPEGLEAAFANYQAGGPGNDQGIPQF
jgi:hypothetical protein